MFMTRLFQAMVRTGGVVRLLSLALWTPYRLVLYKRPRL
jgi:hypothetical protein